MYSVLIIGASGGLGQALIRVLSTHPSNPSIHAFVRTPSKLPPRETNLCQTVQQGDALDGEHIQRALELTQPNTVIVTIGVPNSVAKSELRENSAKTLMQAIHPESTFGNTRVVCISSLGAGGSKIILGFGIGSLLTFHLRKVLRDHDRQEKVFLNSIGEGKAHRLLIVRPTALSNGKTGGKVVTFGDEEKAPSFSIDREDVAKYVVGQVCGSGDQFGRAVNVGTTRN